MSYPLPTDGNLNASAGLGELFSYANNTTNGILFIMILIAVYIITLFGIARFKEDYPAAFAAAGFLTGVFAMFLKLASLINNITLSITIIIAVISVMGLFFSSDR